MNVANLMNTLQESGIRLTVAGDRLHVEAPVGTYTPELRALLANRKADLIIALSEGRARPVQGDRSAPVISIQNKGAAASGWNTSRDHLVAIADDAERKAGRVPAGDSAKVVCGKCGPVFLHPSIVAVLPVVNGWPHALGCPWCFITKDGLLAIPRPSVTCGSCAHFIADTINPESGAGRCKLGIRPRRTPHPFTPQYCGSWRP